MSILRLDHYKAVGKCSIAIFSESTSNNVLPVSRYSFTGPLSMICVQFWPNDLSSTVLLQFCFFYFYSFDPMTEQPLLRVIRGHKRPNPFFASNFW